MNQPTHYLLKKKKYGLIVGIIVAVIAIVLLVTYFTNTLSFNLISNTVLVTWYGFTNHLLHYYDSQ